MVNTSNVELIVVVVVVVDSNAFYLMDVDRYTVVVEPLMLPVLTLVDMTKEANQDVVVVCIDHGLMLISSEQEDLIHDYKMRHQIVLVDA